VLRLRKPDKHTANVKAESGTNGNCEPRRILADELMVRAKVVERELPDGLIVEGEKVHDAPAGNPEQAKEMFWLNPFSGETVNTLVAVPVVGIEIDLGFSENEKLGADKFTT
jgi:hypothetical protein